MKPEDQQRFKELANTSMHTFLGRMHEEQHTALVRVGQGLGAGILFIEYGEIVRAEWPGAAEGLDAVHAMMALCGELELMIMGRNLSSVHPNISAETQEILEHYGEPARMTA